MGPEQSDDVVLAQSALAAIERRGDARAIAMTVDGDALELPDEAVAAMTAVLRLLSAGRTVVVSPEVIEAADRPWCAECGEPVVLATPDDPDSWVHAPDANDLADHTALVPEGPKLRRA